MLSTRIRTRSSFQAANDTIRSFASDTVGKLLAVACFVFAIGNAKGGEMQPWGGASAEASAWQDTTSSAQGLNSTATLHGNRSFGYRDHHGDGYTGRWGVETTAQVFDSKTRMIGVSDGTGASWGGYSDGANFFQVPTEAYAQASWNNDSIHIQPMNGQSLPDKVNLVFEATLDLPTHEMMAHAKAGVFGSIDLNINDKSKTFDGSDFSTTDPNSSIVKFFDGGVTSTDPSMYASAQKATGLVSIALAVNANGWTDPFSLSVKSTPGSSFHGSDPFGFTKGITVGLKDLTTLDGLSLESQGYKISYASDLTVPSPVPEPASWIVMATVFTAILFYRNVGGGSSGA